MILAYDSLGDELRLSLIDEKNSTAYRKTVSADPAQRIPRFDLLRELVDFLEAQQVATSQLTGIAFVRGPGRFTAVRTACIVANAFSRHSNIKLYPVTKAELAEYKGDFAQLFASGQITTTDHAEPLFDSPPRIHVAKQG